MKKQKKYKFELSEIYPNDDSETSSVYYWNMLQCTKQNIYNYLYDKNIILTLNELEQLQDLSDDVNSAFIIKRKIPKEMALFLPKETMMEMSISIIDISPKDEILTQFKAEINLFCEFKYDHYLHNLEKKTIVFFNGHEEYYENIHSQY